MNEKTRNGLTWMLDQLLPRVDWDDMLEELEPGKAHTTRIQGAALSIKASDDGTLGVVTEIKDWNSTDNFAVKPTLANDRIRTALAFLALAIKEAEEQEQPRYQVGHTSMACTVFKATAVHEIKEGKGPLEDLRDDPDWRVVEGTLEELLDKAEGLINNTCAGGEGTWGRKVGRALVYLLWREALIDTGTADKMYSTRWRIL